MTSNNYKLTRRLLHKKRYGLSLKLSYSKPTILLYIEISLIEKSDRIDDGHWRRVKVDSMQMGKNWYETFAHPHTSGGGVGGVGDCDCDSESENERANYDGNGENRKSKIENGKRGCGVYQSVSVLESMTSCQAARSAWRCSCRPTDMARRGVAWRGEARRGDGQHRWHLTPDSWRATGDRWQVTGDSDRWRGETRKPVDETKREELPQPDAPRPGLLLSLTDGTRHNTLYHHHSLRTSTTQSIALFYFKSFHLFQSNSILLLVPN